jgi:hypothetical protein
MTTSKPKRPWLQLVKGEATATTVRRRWLLLVAAALLAVPVPVNREYHVFAVYQSVPTDPVPLEKWLMAQNGIFPGTVSVHILKVDVHAEFVMWRSLGGWPFFPNLAKACQSLGFTPGPETVWRSE